MKIRIRYSGLLAEIVGKSFDEIELCNTISIEELIKIVVDRHKSLREWLEKLPLLHIFLNGIEVTGRCDILLRDSDEIVISPPLYEGG